MYNYFICSKHFNSNAQAPCTRKPKAKFALQSLISEAKSKSNQIRFISFNMAHKN